MAHTCRPFGISGPQCGPFSGEFVLREHNGQFSSVRDRPRVDTAAVDRLRDRLRSVIRGILKVYGRGVGPGWL